jgi:hypothetical protein
VIGPLIGLSTRIRLSSLSIIGLAAWSGLCAAACPPNTLECLSSSIVSTNPSNSATCSGPPNDPGSGNASYDLRAGHLALNAGGFDWSGGIFCSDEFQLAGIAPGPTYALTLVGHLKVNWSRSLPGGSMSFDLSAGVPGLNGFRLYGIGSVDTTLTCAISVTPGHEWSLGSSLDVGQGGGSMKCAYDYSFANLPPGAFVTSCQGFRQDSPVPALAMTWGRCKATYR